MPVRCHLGLSLSLSFLLLHDGAHSTYEQRLKLTRSTTALTSLYGAYHDIYRGGQYIWVIRDMHAKYGPIVRIRPEVLHVNDPGFIDTLYSSAPGSRRERAPTFVMFSHRDDSTLFTADHALHRRRRASIARFFSQQNVRRLVPAINRTVEALLGRMDGWAAEGRPVALNPAFQATTKDVIQSYALGDGRKCLEMDHLNKPFFDVLRSERVAHVCIHFHTFSKLLTQLPVSVLTRLMPSIAGFIEFNKVRLPSASTPNPQPPLSLAGLAGAWVPVTDHLCI